MTETPICLALVLCDHVHRDPTTGKFSILGTLEDLTAGAFPARLQFAVYFAITGGAGPNQLKMRLIHSDAVLSGDREGVMFELPMIEIMDPIAVIQSCFSVTGTFESSGQYHCELFANDEPLMMRRLTLHDARQMDNQVD